jgi:hypothetical protein
MRRRRRRFSRRSRGGGTGSIRRRGETRRPDLGACGRKPGADEALSKTEIDGYLATGDWQGKAGGYSIQGPAGAFIPWISGSHSAIVGLPLAETANLLTAAGYPVWRAP